ncbi:hypothetical protein JCM8547_005510 [Rhodosporidiobolus lusitaniae]
MGRRGWNRRWTSRRTGRSTVSHDTPRYRKTIQDPFSSDQDLLIYTTAAKLFTFLAPRVPSIRITYDLTDEVKFGCAYAGCDCFVSASPQYGGVLVERNQCFFRHSHSEEAEAPGAVQSPNFKMDEGPGGQEDAGEMGEEQAVEPEGEAEVAGQGQRKGGGA